MNRLFFSIILCLAFCGKTNAQIYADGDINKDGKVDVTDVAHLAQKIIANEGIKTPEALIAGTWKTSDGKEMILNADGTTEFEGAASFKYAANDGYIYLYNADKKIMKVYEVENICSAYMAIKGISEEESTIYYSPYLIEHPVVKVEYQTIIERINYFPKTGDDMEAIDLGLPSGKLWANMNVGANSPEEVGYYYAWGEQYRKSTYNSNNYVGDPSVDIAKITHGEEWYVPSKDDFMELYNYTEHTNTELNGVNGVLYTGYNGNSIFLPYTGIKIDTGLYYADNIFYATSYYNGSLNAHVYYGSGVSIINTPTGYDTSVIHQRYYGYNYRAIRDKITE